MKLRQGRRALQGNKVNGITRFLICWVGLALAWAVFVGQPAPELKYVAAAIVAALVDPILAVVAAVAAVVWTKLAGAKKVEESAQERA